MNRAWTCRRCAVGFGVALLGCAYALAGDPLPVVTFERQPYSGTTFAQDPILGIDLDAYPFVVPSDVRVINHSLALSELAFLRDSVGLLTIQQQFARNWFDDNFNRDSPYSATDLQAQTVSIPELLDGGFGVSDDSRLILGRGLIAQPGGGPNPGDPRLGGIWLSTIRGGLDYGDNYTAFDLPSWNREAENGRVTTGRADFALAEMTIENGPLNVNAAPDDQGRPGQTLVQISSLQGYNSPLPWGISTFRNVTVPDTVRIDTYDDLIIENGLHLDGQIDLAINTDTPASLILRGDQVVTGTGSIVAHPDNPSDLYSSVITESGHTTVGPGITLVTNARDGYLLGGPNYSYETPLRGALTMQGRWEARMSPISRNRINAGTLTLDGEIDWFVGHVDVDVDRLVVTPNAQLELGGLVRFDYNESQIRLNILLEVSGETELAGHLDLKLHGVAVPTDYVPHLGDRRVIIDAASVSGVFDSVAVEALDAGDPVPEGLLPADVTLAVLYTATSVEAELALIGDVTLDGQVEQADLDVVLHNWGRNNFGDGGPGVGDAGVSWVTGDLDGSGRVEQGDLDAVLAHWGGVAAPDFRGVSVPEPGVPALLSVVLTAGTRRLRSGR